MNRRDLTNEQWERLRPLLPSQHPRRGRPPKDHRRILNGLLWLIRTGAPWRDLPSEYGPWQTVATRFYRWRRAGIWDRVLADLQQQADVAGDLDWSLHHVDGTIIFAHQHAAGAQKRGRSLEVSRRGLGTEPGRLWHQDPRLRRGTWQADGRADHGRTAPRTDHVRGVDGDRRLTVANNRRGLAE